MGLLSTFKSWFICHLIIGYMYITSGLIIDALMLVVMLLVWPVSKSLYRRIIERLAYMLWSQVAFVLQFWSGSECEIIMEEDGFMTHGGKESAFIILNHKYDIDWAMGYVVCDKVDLLGNSKVYAKSSLLLTPVIGWTWYFTETIFVKRNWKEDSSTIPDHINEYRNYPEDLHLCILLFPEGTRFTKEKQVASNLIARKKGMPELKHHLLPRTRGFVESMKHLKGVVPAIYDCVVAFTPDSARPDVLSVISGKSCKAQMKVRRIPLDEVPTHTDEAAAEWLQELFRKKDEEFEYFVQHGRFKGKVWDVPRRPHSAFIFAFWFMVLVVPVAWYLISVFINGTFYVKMVAVVSLVVVSSCVKLLISVTQIEKSSHYGHKGKKTPAGGETNETGGVNNIHNTPHGDTKTD